MGSTLDVLKILHKYDSLKQAAIGSVINDTLVGNAPKITEQELTNLKAVAKGGHLEVVDLDALRKDVAADLGLSAAQKSAIGSAIDVLVIDAKARAKSDEESGIGPTAAVLAALVAIACILTF